jgi:serine/threonine protein kinase
VAIKKIANPFAVPLEAKRLLREIRLLRMLRHPNIIAIKARLSRLPRALLRRRCAGAAVARAARNARGARAARRREQGSTQGKSERSRDAGPTARPPPPPLRFQEILRPSDAASFRDLYIVYELMATDLYQARARVR